MQQYDPATALNKNFFGEFAYLHFYITKIIDYVGLCMYVSMSTTMRFVVLCGIELKLNMGLEDSPPPPGLRAYFRSDRTKG